VVFLTTSVCKRMNPVAPGATATGTLPRSTARKQTSVMRNYHQNILTVETRYVNYKQILQVQYCKEGVLLFANRFDKMIMLPHSAHLGSRMEILSFIRHIFIKSCSIVRTHFCINLDSVKFPWPALGWALILIKRVSHQGIFLPPF
jgi:hypothetical protein